MYSSTVQIKLTKVRSGGGGGEVLYTCIKLNTREEVGHKTRVKLLFLCWENDSAHCADVPRAVRLRELQFGERRRDTTGEVSEVRVGRLDGILEYLRGKKNKSTTAVRWQLHKVPSNKNMCCYWGKMMHLSIYWPCFQKWHDTIQV